MSTQASGTSRVVTIAAHRPFLDDLAAGLLATYTKTEELAHLRIFLPNRRAAQALKDTFIRLKGTQAFLLPRIAAIGDMTGLEAYGGPSQHDLNSEADPLKEAEMALDLPPAIDPLRRRAVLAHEISRWRARGKQTSLSPAQFLSSADALINLLDETQIEGCALERIEELAGQDYAEHWGVILEFLSLLKKRWPRVLKQEACLDPMDRRNRALRALADLWRTTPPAYPVVAAGSTGSVPATAQLLVSIAAAANGTVVLPGLDRDLDEDSWQQLDPLHPQYALKQLLELMDKRRDEVGDWRTPDTQTPPEGDVTKDRQDLLRRAFLPVALTPIWATTPPPSERAWDGLEMVECHHPREEAMIAALALRETLETPGKTAALITTDRNLARCVTVQLRRWNIQIDDSAGRPLAGTRVGTFLCLIAEAVCHDLDPISFTALCQHPLAAGGRTPGDFRKLARSFAHKALRGPRPPPGTAGLYKALEKVSWPNGDEISDWLDTVLSCLDPLTKAGEAGHTPDAVDLVQAHMHAAQSLAQQSAEEGEGEDDTGHLWRGEDGRSARDILDRLASAVAGWGHLSVRDYLMVLRDVFTQVRVYDPPAKTPPRLFIWGSLEARLQTCDRMIIGGLNEGSWPHTAQAGPWLGRHMRETIGLKAPEWRIGLAAHDFTQLAAKTQVLMTRSIRAQGAPTEASRWWRRLALFAPRHNLHSLDGSKTDTANTGPDTMSGAGRYRVWAQTIDRPDHPRPRPRPEAFPPQTSRPRKISVTGAQTLITDPYAFYAGYILKLRPLDALDTDPDQREYGRAIHKILAEFCQKFPKKMPDNAPQELRAIGKRILKPWLDMPVLKALWGPHFEAICDQFIAWDRQRRAQGMDPLIFEKDGSIELEKGVTLTARVDRIDRLPGGGLDIIDYKTGEVPSWEKVKRREAPQLPLEAAVALEGGFGKIDHSPTIAAMTYLKLQGDRPSTRPAESRKISRQGENDLHAWANEARTGLLTILKSYADPHQEYQGVRGTWRTDNKWQRHNDYIHLIRHEEWL